MPTLFILDFKGTEEGRSGYYGAFGSADAANGYAGILAARTPDAQVSWTVIPLRHPELPEEPQPDA
jgi:hypothetical protein